MRARVGTVAEADAATPSAKGDAMDLPLPSTAPARIAAIADLVPPCRVVCEVGYDRGLILWTLLGARPDVRAIGVEIQPASATTTPIPGPLAGRVELRTGDGLLPIAPGEVDGVILAGLGGRTIVGVLESRPDVVARLDFVVTCPSHLEADVRPALLRLGLGIADERIVFDRGRYYEVVVARPLRRRLAELALPAFPALPALPALSALPADADAVDLAACDEVAAAWGPLLLARDPLMADYLDDHERRFHAAFASGLASYRDGAKAALGRKLALLSEARQRLGSRPLLG